MGRNSLAASTSALSQLLFTIATVGASSNKVAFPADYATGVMYTSHDLVDAEEFREFYITPTALAAVRQDQRPPSGTVITLARYNVQLDARGNPLKDVDGRLIKAELKAFRVMEKRTGWGSEYPTQWRMGISSVSG